MKNMKNYKLFNESLKNKMVGKKPIDIINDIENRMNNSDEFDLDISGYKLFDLLKIAYNTNDSKKIVQILLDNNYLDCNDIIEREIEYFDEYFYQYEEDDAKRLLNQIIDIIKKGDNYN